MIKVIKKGSYNNIKCNKYNKIMKGEINKLKQHEAGISGEVSVCMLITDEDRHICRENLERIKKKS